MLTPAQAAQEEAERASNAFFDGILPPFSNVGNQYFGQTPDAPTLQGKGQARDFSTANPTSAYDVATFGKVSIDNKDILPSTISNRGPEAAARARKQARAKNAESLVGAPLPGFSDSAWNPATPEQAINADSGFN
jgi:hypothetical protein